MTSETRIEIPMGELVVNISNDNKQINILFEPNSPDTECPNSYDIAAVTLAKCNPNGTEKDYAELPINPNDEMRSCNHIVVKVYNPVEKSTIPDTTSYIKIDKLPKA